MPISSHESHPYDLQGEINGLARGKNSGTFHIAFRLGDEKFKKSLRTASEDEAKARLERVKENLRLVECGRLAVPDDADIATFLLSDGKLNAPLKTSKSITLGKLFETYVEDIPDTAMEAESLQVAGIHMAHIRRILGRRTRLRSVDTEKLQKYVTKRSAEPGKRGNVSLGTIKKELSTFSSLWTSATTRDFVSAAFPKAGLKYPKYEEKPPFQTWSQIDRQIRQGNLITSKPTLTSGPKTGVHFRCPIFRLSCDGCRLVRPSTKNSNP